MKTITERLQNLLIPAVPVPWDGQGIDLAAQANYIDYMQSQGVKAAAVWVHTGRGLELDFATRQEVLKAWRQGLGAEALIVAGVGAKAEADQEKYLQAAVKMGKEAVAGGADAFLVFPPTMFRGKPEQDELILAYHQELATLGKPLILFYLYEEAGGINYSPKLLAQLFAIPQVIGIKMASLDSVMTYQDVARLIKEQFPQQCLITGEDRMFPYSLMRGAKAALIGLGAAFPRKQQEMLLTCAQQDWPRFMELAAWVEEFAELTFIQPMEHYIIRLLWVLVALGVIPASAANDPCGCTLTQAEIKRLYNFVAKWKGK